MDSSEYVLPLTMLVALSNVASDGRIALTVFYRDQTRSHVQPYHGWVYAADPRFVHFTCGPFPVDYDADEWQVGHVSRRPPFATRGAPEPFVQASAAPSAPSTHSMSTRSSGSPSSDEEEVPLAEEPLAEIEQVSASTHTRTHAHLRY